MSVKIKNIMEHRITMHVQVVPSEIHRMILYLYTATPTACRSGTSRRKYLKRDLITQSIVALTKEITNCCYGGSCSKDVGGVSCSLSIVRS